MQHRWRASRLEGPQTIDLSDQGIAFGDRVLPWAALSDAGFVRYTVRGGVNEEFHLSFGPDDRRRLRWVGQGRERAEWRAMLVDFARHAGRLRPDLTVRDGPDASERRAAARIGVAVGVLALVIMGAVLMSGPSFVGGLVAVWIGLVGAVIGGVIRAHYTRQGEAPRLDWAGFAAREGQAGELPAN